MAQGDYKSVLADLGLSPNESAIYEFLLSNGPAPASAIAKQTAIKRTNAYHILDQLSAKQLIEKSISGPKTLFSANHPRALVKQVERQEQKLLGVRQHIHSVMDSLAETYANAMNKPGALPFCGTDEYIDVHARCGKHDELCLTLIDGHSALSLLGPTFEKVTLKRRERTKHVDIHTCSKVPDRILNLFLDNAIRIRELAPHPDTPLGMELTCSESCSVIATFDKSQVTGVCIEDPSISRSMMLFIRALCSTIAIKEP